MNTTMPDRDRGGGVAVVARLPDAACMSLPLSWPGIEFINFRSIKKIINRR